MEPVVQRLNEKNVAACSGKELRKERKELMREWQERLGARVVNVWLRCGGLA